MDRITAYNYQEYVKTKKFFFQHLSEDEKEEIVEKEYNELLSASYISKYEHFAALIALISEDEFLSSKYIINENAYYWEHKI